MPQSIAMKHNIIISIGLLSGAFFLSQSNTTGQEVNQEANLFVIRYIDVEDHNQDAFVKEVTKKNKKFNRSEGSDQWWTYRILTGVRSGQFARGFGPKSWSDLDAKKTTQTLQPTPNHEEVIYWKENIRPLEKEIGNTEVWQNPKGLIYTGLGEISGSQAPQTRYGFHRHWKMKPGMYKRLEAHYVKLKKVFEANKIPVNWAIYRLVAGGDFMTYSESVFFNDWKSYGSVRIVRDLFDKVHGDGSWDSYLAEHNEIMQENATVEGEFWQYLEDLSSKKLSD